MSEKKEEPSIVVACPKCQKHNLAGTKEKLICPDCGDLGSLEDVKNVGAEKEESKPEPEKKPEAKVEETKLVCPKCEKKPLLKSVDGMYCRICGRIGSVDEIEKIFKDKEEAELKAMADHQMPPLPKMKDWTDPDLKQFFQEMVDYMAWLGKHFRMEDNFICKCGKYYSPKKKACPACFPTGPGRKI